MASPDQDPYYLAENNIASAARGLEGLYEKWNSLVFETNTYTNKEFKWTRKEMKKVLQDIEDDLSDIEEVIGTIEKFPGRYHLLPGELQRRKSFANDVRTQINRIKSSLNDPSILRKIEDDKTKELLTADRINQIEKTSRFDGLKRAHEEDNRDYVRDNHQFQQQLYQQQDQGLDEMHTNLIDLKEMGENMHTELKVQAGILDRLHERAENSSALLGSVMRKLDRFMETTSSKLQWTIIAILGVIFIALVLLTTMVKK
ncbi:hypothetical protein DICPUDRAFT_93942 [Dictyostelium purpureum]|uniref:t-SNARE coiled-coil homology domain-containing protein n=1 Tax=Dictyostelium purpureum TaxID=5786 RepID=F0ZDI6_DICPU|nr:uncharacterized protein DICPUDRAFT_93942 [Dictyostelium purpureum]EGC37988.1 hypothetical protein DICPUDRAFT_93942 [Dictyostelium purpureum]|eukprot:XP_003285472.1 hypothetical protein DICPUDRAFT_93942 [Dictyostelium purpureum]